MEKTIYEQARQKALAIYEKAHIVLTSQEKANLEVADFGLNDLERTGLEIITYVNTERCCAKEMVLFPRQTCPEHRHAPIEGTPYVGKEETFRVRFGTCYLYVDGEVTENPACNPPEGRETWYTARHEIMLLPGEQYTLHPNMRHWFQAGPEGAVISEFSTKSYDEHDIFTDPDIIRLSIVE